MKPADKVIISLLAAADCILFVFIGCYVLFTGGGNAFKGIKGTSAFGVTDLYYNTAYSFADLSVNHPVADYPYGIQDKFKELYATNPDTIAWVKSVNTSIDFVVMQAEDNDKYLRRDFYHNYSVRGTVFMDYRNNVTTDWNCLSKNTVLYGHNFSEGGQMIFEDIQKYQDLDYYKEHPVMLMDTIYNSYKWKVVGAFMCYPIDVNSDDLFYYWATDFSDEITLGFTDEVKLRSFFVSPDVDIRPDDKFLTLSTCVHMPTKKGEVVGRFVLVSRLVRQGESPAVNTDIAYLNTQNRMPQVWYEYRGLENPYENRPIWNAFA